MTIENFVDSSPCRDKKSERISEEFNSVRDRAYSSSFNQTQQFIIIKPIALRPYQAFTKTNNTQNSSIISMKNFLKFKSIDTIDSPSVTCSGCIQRRNTMPRLNTLSSKTVNANLAINISQQPQRPHLDFIKMKLQKFRLNNESYSQENALISKLNSLDLNINFEKMYNTNFISDYACLRRKQIFSSSSSIFSSVSTSSYLSYRNELTESDLDLDQIENDLNY